MMTDNRHNGAAAPSQGGRITYIDLANPELLDNPLSNTVSCFWVLFVSRLPDNPFPGDWDFLQQHAYRRNAHV